MEPVKQHLIQYSHVQEEYWFYDPDHPRVIAFCRNGRWEAEYVTDVQYTAKDHRILDVAISAASRQVQRWDHSATPISSPNADVAPLELSAPVDSGLQLPPLRSALYPNALSTGQPPTPLTPTSSTSSPGQESRPPTSTSHPPPTYQQPPGASDARSPFTATRNSSWRNWASGEWQRKPGSAGDTALPIAQQPRQMRIVLSLDGDGVRGLSTAVIVDALVTAVGRRIGRKLEAYQIFDIIGGTSTGGLLAIMLGRLRIPSDRALNAYLGLSRTLFTNKCHFFNQKQHLIRPGVQGVLTEPEPAARSLERELRDLAKTHLEKEDELFWDTNPESPNVFVISTLISNDRMRPAIIRSYPTRRITNPVIKNDLKTWEAMCATAAGLRYTNAGDPSAEPSGLLVDGSIKKSNPIREIFYECRSLYHINDPMMMVSIGTGAAPQLNAATRSEFRDMAENVISSERSALNVSAKFEWDEREILGSEWLKYFRFCDPGMVGVGLEEWGDRERIEAGTRQYLATGEAGQRFRECVEAIARVVMGERLNEGGAGVGAGLESSGLQAQGYVEVHGLARGGVKRKRPGG